MDQPAEKSPGGYDYRFRKKSLSRIGDDSFHPSVVNKEIVHQGLPQEQILLALQYPLHSQVIEMHVRLGSGRPDCRPFLGIQPAELDSGLIRIFSHLPTQSIDLLNQLSFSQSPDSRVAGHPGHCLQADGKEQGGMAHAGTGQRCFAPGMAGSDDDDLILGRVSVQELSLKNL